MRLSRFVVENYTRFPAVELAVRDHLVLVGANDVGKTSLLGCLNILLGASIQQIYQTLSVDHFVDPSLPVVFRATLVNFTDDERAAFPDDIAIDVDSNESLTIELEVRVSDDDPDSVVVRRYFPETSGRAVSREQLGLLGWHFLPASRSAANDLMDGRRSPLRTLLSSADLGEGGESLRQSLEQFNELLSQNPALAGLRERIAMQLSQSMPKGVEPEELSLRTTADPNADPLEDVSLFVRRGDQHAALRDQSDGVRQLMTMSFFDLAREAANIVAVDEPELHLHASSQRAVADLFAHGSTQRIIVTHSPYILQRFEPSHLAVISPDRSVKQVADAELNLVEKERASWWSPHLLEALTARHVLLVEGVADRIFVEAAARSLGVSLDRIGVTVLDIGGAENFRHVNRLLGEKGFALDLSGLVDHAESGSWIGGLKVKKNKVNVEKVFVCAVDLEAEYVAGMGAPTVARALISEGFKKQAILQSTAAGSLGQISPDAMAAFMRKNKVTGAVAVGNHVSADQIARMPAISGLLAYVSGR